MPKALLRRKAFAALFRKLLAAYPPDDGALTARDRAWLRKRVAGKLPTGTVIGSASLF